MKASIPYRRIQYEFPPFALFQGCEQRSTPIYGQDLQAISISLLGVLRLPGTRVFGLILTGPPLSIDSILIGNIPGIKTREFGPSELSESNRATLIGCFNMGAVDPLCSHRLPQSSIACTSPEAPID